MSDLNFIPVETEAQKQTAFPLMQGIYSDLDYATFVTRLDRAQKIIYKLHLIYDASEVVGLAALSRFGNMLAGDVMYLEEMAVAPDKRGQGYGKKIIESVKQIARNEGRVAIYTDDSTPMGEREEFLIKSGGRKISNFYEFKVAA
jgi:N-acetylglutamate synthase-like GNAT family acetyltransferase